MLKSAQLHITDLGGLSVEELRDIIPCLQETHNPPREGKKYLHNKVSSQSIT